MRDQLTEADLPLSDIDKASRYLKKKEFQLEGTVFSKGEITVEVTNQGFDYQKGKFVVRDLSLGELKAKFRKIKTK